MDEYNTKRSVMVKQINGMIDRAAKPSKGKPAVDTNDIIELQYQLADLEREEVKPLRLLADDVTPEALISLMAGNDGKIAKLTTV